MGEGEAVLRASTWALEQFVGSGTKDGMSLASVSDSACLVMEL